MNFFIAMPQSPKVTERSALMPAVDQLAEAADAEARRQHLVLDAAAQRGGHADDEVDAVLFLQLAPAVDDVAVVLRRLGEPRRVVDAVVIEEDAHHLVPGRWRRRRSSRPSRWPGACTGLR
jgi:hypothetical protein